MLKIKVFLEKKCRKIALEDSKLSALKRNSGAGFLLPCGCRKMLFCLSKPFGNNFVTSSLHDPTIVHWTVNVLKMKGVVPFKNHPQDLVSTFACT